MATLATGVLGGPAGSGIISGGNVSQFFDQLLNWYGNDTLQTAPAASFNDHGNPIAVLPTVEPVQPERPTADHLRGLQRLRPLGGLGRPCPPAAVVPDHERAGGQRPARHPAQPRSIHQQRGAGRRPGVDDRAVHRREPRLHPDRPAAAVHRQLPERPAGFDHAGRDPHHHPARPEPRRADLPPRRHQGRRHRRPHPQQHGALPGRFRLHADQGVHPPRQRRGRPPDRHRDLAAPGDRPADGRGDHRPEQGPAAAQQRRGGGRRVRHLHREAARYRRDRHHDHRDRDGALQQRAPARHGRPGVHPRHGRPHDPG